MVERLAWSWMWTAAWTAVLVPLAAAHGQVAPAPHPPAGSSHTPWHTSPPRDAFLAGPPTPAPFVDPVASWPDAGLKAIAEPATHCHCGLASGGCLSCDPCPPQAIMAILGYEAFRGHPDGGWGNWGLHTGFHYATRLGALSDRTGIGLQIGGTTGVYDWSGTDYRMQNRDQAQTQGFITYGLFRKPQPGSPWSAALVHDWMLNHTFSVFGEDPTLSQWRAQLGYMTSPSCAFGLWGAWRGLEDTRDVNGFGPVTWRPINQLNAYWHSKWGPGGADTWIWLGVPERNRLNGDGSLGDYLVGARAECPLGDGVALYTLLTYMHPSATAGPSAAREEAWSFAIGLSFFPRRNARSTTVAGQCWTPQLPIATNGYFLVDASAVY